MMRMKLFFKKNIRIILTFFSVMFLQFVILRMGNQAGQGYLSEEKQEKVYIFLQLFMVGGIAAHILLCEFLKKNAVIRRILMVAAGVSGIGAEFLLFSSPASAVYLAVTYTTVFSLGLVVGAVYLRMAEYASEKNNIGICMGIGYSAALLLQFVFQLTWQIVPVLAVLLPVSAVLSVIFLKERQAPRLEETGVERIPLSGLLSSLAIAAAMLLFVSFYSGYIHHLQVATAYSEFNVYTWPRLLLIPGMLLFGCIGDLREGKYIPLASLCVSVVALLNAILVEKPGYYWLNMCLYYIALSAVIAYYNLTFWKISLRSRHPAVWSVAGRVLDSILVIPLCLIQNSNISGSSILSLNIAALIMIIVLMAVSGGFNLGGMVTEDFGTSYGGVKDPLTALGERFGFTPSEQRVFRELVETEDKQVVIAERLSIKVRTVQANVTSIYRKTGVNTRSGLVQLYHSNRS